MAVYIIYHQAGAHVSPTGYTAAAGSHILNGDKAGAIPYFSAITGDTPYILLSVKTAHSIAVPYKGHGSAHNAAYAAAFIAAD